MLDYCKENGIQFWAYMVLEQGALSGKYNVENPLPAESERGRKYNPILGQLTALTDAMKEIGAGYGLSCSQVGIAWALSKGTIPIIGATRERHVLEAAQVMDTVLSPKEITRLEAIKAHGMEMDEGFPIPAWEAEEHLKFMDEAGIQTSVLTMPAPQPYFGDGAESAAVCRKFNEEAAALKALYPGRFLFCAALPLPDVDRALEEARYALAVLGADGVKLATNSYGQYLGDEALEPMGIFI